MFLGKQGAVSSLRRVQELTHSLIIPAAFLLSDRSRSGLSLCPGQCDTLNEIPLADQEDYDQR
jgi:PIN domain nuclease of toxin-antitoxin system